MAERKSAFESLQDTRQALKDAEFDKRLSPKGKKLLEAIEAGAWTSPTVSNFLQGLTFNTVMKLLGGCVAK
tara:strand:- start:55 stop:267 length:213 start_codon:yes stop_codon:yes gene_type:complete